MHCLARRLQFLKEIFSDELKLDGVWDQPGGDKKIFSTADISIS